MPLKIKGGSYIESSKDKNSKCNRIPNSNLQKFLTEDQAEFICNKVNARQKIDSQIIQKEMISNPDENSYKMQY